jgi:hypothetical protein
MFYISFSTVGQAGTAVVAVVHAAGMLCLAFAWPPGTPEKISKEENKVRREGRKEGNIIAVINTTSIAEQLIQKCKTQKIGRILLAGAR